LFSCSFRLDRLLILAPPVGCHLFLDSKAVRFIAQSAVTRLELEKDGKRVRVFYAPSSAAAKAASCGSGSGSDCAAAAESKKTDAECEASTTACDGKEQVALATCLTSHCLRSLKGDVPSLQSVVVDRIVSNCGYRPDLSISRELQVHYCWASEGTMKLAASLLGASGDCLKQAAPSAEVMLNPERAFFVLGAKSYGRTSSFLLRVGLEQIDSVFGLISKL
jgi:hypothetical protein